MEYKTDEKDNRAWKRERTLNHVYYSFTFWIINTELHLVSIAGHKQWTTKWSHWSAKNLKTKKQRDCSWETLAVSGSCPEKAQFTDTWAATTSTVLNPAASLLSQYNAQYMYTNSVLDITFIIVYNLSI